MTQVDNERIAGVPPADKHKHWHSRGYLPHCDTPGLVQSITFRLADSLPVGALARCAQEAGSDLQRRKKIDTLLDAGHGECLLARPDIGRLVEDALLHQDGLRYRLLAWCVMPNHVHVLIQTITGWPLGDIVQSWKSFTAHAINKRLARNGKVWMEDYFDRYIRDDAHYAAVVVYIHANPVKAGLAAEAARWPLSSAGK